MKSASFAVIVAALILSCGTAASSYKLSDMVADMDPVSVGNVEAQFERAFSSKLDTVDITALFFPRLNAVALEFRYDYITYRQFWDETARRQFIGALELYKADYAERKLINRYSRTRAIYGRAAGLAEWETFKFSETYVAYPIMEIGYRFRDNAPFLATSMLRSPVVIKDSINDPNRADSQQINMYFTRAQADDLAQLFDQSYLMGVLQPE